MINFKTVIGCFLIAAAFIVFFLILYNEHSDHLNEKTLVSNASSFIGEINKVIIRTPKKQFSLIHDNTKGWFIPELLNNRVKKERVDYLLKKISSLSVLSKKTKDSSLYSTLGVSKDKSNRITFYKDKEIILDLLFGNASLVKGSLDKQNIYLRQVNQSQVWLVRGILPNYYNINYWFNNQIVAFPFNEVKYLLYTNEQGKTIVWEREFNVLSIAYQEKHNETMKFLKQSKSLQNLPFMIERLSFNTVIPLKEFQSINILNPNLSVHFQTGESLDYFLLKDSEQLYVKINYNPAKESLLKNRLISEEIQTILTNHVFLSENEQLLKIESKIQKVLGW